MKTLNKISRNYRSGNAYLLSDIFPVNIFSGLENGLEMSQLYTAIYSCDFNLLMFPFDAQVRLGLFFNYVYVSMMNIFARGSGETLPLKIVV